MQVAGFDWDKGNIKKCQKHGVGLQEIEEVFKNAPAVFPDVKHSDKEERFLAIGLNNSERYVFVAFTFRIKGGKKYIRPISARYMHKKEIEHYKKLKNSL